MSQKVFHQLICIFFTIAILVACAAPPEGNSLVPDSDSQISLTPTPEPSPTDTQELPEPTKKPPPTETPTALPEAVPTATARSSPPITMLHTSGEVITPDNTHKLIQMGSLDSSWADGAVSFSPSGDILATTDINGPIKLYSMATGKLLTEIKTDIGSINSITFSPDGKLLAAGGGHKAQVWDLVTLEQIFKSVFRGTVYDVALSPDSSFLATAWGGGGWACGSGGSIKLLDLSTGGLVSDFRLMGKGLPGGFDLSSMVVDMKGVAFSPDGKTLAGINACGVSALWKMSTQEELTKLVGVQGYGYAVAFSPDGQLLATSGSASDSDSTADLRIWNVSTGELLHTLKGHTDAVTKVAFNPDGQILASNSGDGSIRLWEVATGDVLKVLDQNLSDCFAFSPDGTLLATGGDQILLWGIP